MTTRSQEEVIAANIVKCIASSLSLTASSVIVHMIRNSPRGLKSSYSRIIFGLSIGDILQSCGTFIGPFAVPRGTPDSPMAFGTIASCDYSGFLVVLGYLTTVLYLVFLVYFFWRRVKYRISPQKFARKEEKFLHALVWIIALILPIMALPQKAMNPTKYGTYCIVRPYPDSCGEGEEEDENYIECTRGQSAPRLARGVWLVLASSLLCLFLFLGSITCYVRSIEKNLSPTAPSDQQSHEREQEGNADVVEDNQQEDWNEEITNENGGQTENANDTVKKKESLTCRSFHQSVLYILAFIISFGPPFALFANPKLAESEFESLILWVTSTLLPSYGIFLILIYTRPKVKVLSEKFPEASWLLCFWIVITSGGEVPPAHELRAPQYIPSSQIQPQVSHMSPQQEQQIESIYSESAETNGVYYDGLRQSMLAYSRCEGWYVEIEEDSELSM